MKIIFQICLLVVFSLTAAEIAYSCSCLRISNKAEIKMTDVIFTGEVIEIIQDAAYVPPKLEKISPALQQRVNTRKRYLVKFKIYRGFKNINDSEITLARYEDKYSPCPGLIFVEGNKYLVYASKDKDEISGGGICSRTQFFDENSEDYKELLRLRPKSKKKSFS